MTEQSIRIAVEPLERRLLDGVPMEDASGHVRRAVDVGILPVFEDERPLQGLAGFIDWRSSGVLSRLIRSGLCQGKAYEAVLWPSPARLPARRWVLVGLGSLADFDADRAMEAAERMVRTACRLCPQDVMLAMPARLPERRSLEAVFAATVASLGLAESPQSQPPPEDESSTDEGEAHPESEVAPLRLVPRKTWTWWVIAEARHVARLRRLLQGPPRPATPQ